MKQTLQARRMLFILGRGRSGTTLLSHLLNRHEAIVVPPEGFFIKDLARRYAEIPASGRRRRRLQRDFFGEYRRRSWGISPQRLAEELATHPGAMRFETFCQLIYGLYADTCQRPIEPVRWLGDKNPHYALFARELAEVFPEARFIFLTRDPRDNVHSYLQVPFDAASVEALAYRWTIYNRAILEVEMALPERFLRLSYEDLVRAPDAALGRICEFLELPCDAAMLAPKEAHPVHFFGTGKAWHARLRAPLDTRSIGKWQGQLSASDVALISHFCRETAAQLGYDLGSPEVHVVRRKCIVGQFQGWVRTAQERALFYCVPLSLRHWLINHYRARTDRI